MSGWTRRKTLRVEEIDGVARLVVSRSEAVVEAARADYYDFATRELVPLPIGAEVEVDLWADGEYASVEYLWAGHRTSRPVEFFVIRRPGELPWQALERLGLDEENLLP